MFQCFSKKKKKKNRVHPLETVQESVIGAESTTEATRDREVTASSGLNDGNVSTASPENKVVNAKNTSESLAKQEVKSRPKLKWLKKLFLSRKQVQNTVSPIGNEGQFNHGTTDGTLNKEITGLAAEGDPTEESPETKEIRVSTTSENLEKPEVKSNLTVKDFIELLLCRKRVKPKIQTIFSFTKEVLNNGEEKQAEEKTPTLSTISEKQVLCQGEEEQTGDKTHTLSPTSEKQMLHQGEEKQAENKTHTLFPISEKQVLRQGLTNFGNTCYVNASLQCLFRAESFCMQVYNMLQWSDILSPPTDLIRCFLELWSMREIADQQLKDVPLRALIEAVGVSNPEFRVDQQNDAQEFLFHCLSQIEEAWQMFAFSGAVATECPVTSHFKFHLTHILTCCSCESHSISKVEFSYLSVPVVPEGSVEDCLNLFLNVESEFERRCELCQGNTATCRWEFHTLPRILVLQLNRFELTPSFTVRKQQCAVQINPELGLKTKPHCINGSEGHTTSEERWEMVPPLNIHKPPNEKTKSVDRQMDRNELDESTSRYKLISVLSHLGHSTNSGHYLTDCSSQTDFHWLSYNDELVTQMSEEEVMTVRTSSAYVLLYERAQ